MSPIEYDALGAAIMALRDALGIRWRPEKKRRKITEALSHLELLDAKRRGAFLDKDANHAE